MELDFTRLNNLKKLSEEQTKKLAEPKNGLEVNTADLESLDKLQLEANRRKKEIDETARIYEEYQQNIRLSGQLQTDVLNGVRTGENIYSLFLKACKAISFMTCNTVFYSQIEDSIEDIYGQGLLEPLPLSMELQKTQERLTRLRKALDKGEIEPDAKERIQRAIKAHEARIADLESKQK